MTPTDHLTGKAFEQLVKRALDEHVKHRRIHAGRYGVQVQASTDQANGNLEWRPVPSLPDFEGVVFGGRQFVFDAKVCSQASLPLNSDHAPTKQLRHLLARGRMGAVSFLLVHWNARELKTKSEPPQTFVVPVAPHLELWRELETAQRRTLNRLDCQLRGHEITWGTIGLGRTALPLVVEWILEQQASPEAAVLETLDAAMGRPF